MLPKLPGTLAPYTDRLTQFRFSERTMASSLDAILHLLILLASMSFSASTDIFFQGFRGAQNLTLNGGARVTPEGVLQLTNFTEKVVGHAFYSFPVRMLDMTGSAAWKPTAVSFSTTFVFDIVDNGTKGAHGFAFVFAPSTTIGRVNSSQFLGLLGRNENGNFSNHIFAIEFDTFQNMGGADRGYIDMPENHVGVDINSLASNFSAPAAYYVNTTTNASLSLEGGEPIQAWVDYSGKSKVLNVTIAPLTATSKPQKPLLSLVVDLPFVFKEYMYVGFSSSTGLYISSSHYIMGWSFSTNRRARPLDVNGLPRPPSTATSKMSPLQVGAIAVAVTLALVVLAASATWYLWQRAKLGDNIEEWESDYPHRFSYRDLYMATKGFNESELLGAGGFGKVYKGVLPRTREVVAIKKISNNSKQGLREFVAEIACLGRMRHRHLVQLLGWCKKNADLLLIYEFMPNGSLDGALFNREKRFLLSWDDRFKILNGVALGLLYLHEEFEQVMVHRDVKSGNVLLDADMNGKLSDFGLAKLYEHGQNPQTTRVVGTLGYIAPELSYAGKATECSDVYAYGMLLLELACGRKAIEPSAPPRELVLLDKVREHRMKGQLLDVADPQLQGRYVREEMELVLTLGLHCSQSAPECRPTMRQVTQILKGDDKFRDDESLVFTDTDPFDLSSHISYSSTSYGKTSTSCSLPR